MLQGVSRAGGCEYVGREWHEPAARPVPPQSESTEEIFQGSGRWAKHRHRLSRRSSVKCSMLLPALVLATAGLSTDAAPSNLVRSCGSAFVEGMSPLLVASRSPSSCCRAGGKNFSPSSTSFFPGSVCPRRRIASIMQRPAIAHGILGLSAQSQTDEQQGSAAKWRPPPLDNLASRDDDLNPSDDEDEEESEDDTADATGGVDDNGSDALPAASSQVVVGAGALRGEQEAYTMRDVQVRATFWSCW